MAPLLFNLPTLNNPTHTSSTDTTVIALDSLILQLRRLPESITKIHQMVKQEGREFEAWKEEEDMVSITEDEKADGYKDHLQTISFETARRSRQLLLHLENFANGVQDLLA